MSHYGEKQISKRHLPAELIGGAVESDYAVDYCAIKNNHNQL